MDHDAKIQTKIVRLEKSLAREISARQQAEALLEAKSRELYSKNYDLNQHAKLMEAAIINARDAVIITDADLENGGPKIIYVNDAFTRLSGFEFNEVIGKTPKILQGQGTCRQTLENLKETLKKGKPFKGELQNYTKDGIGYWLEISITPVCDEAGKITHFAAIERDITSRKAFEKELQINREAAEVANRVKSDFLANMSHELRTPMNGIIGLSELLKDMKIGSEAQNLAEAVNTSSRNLLILLNDILDLSKIEAGELTLENISFNLRRTINQTLSLLYPLSEKKGLSLECSINDTMPTRIVSDPARIQQIINNLISNAIKFTDEGYVRVKISDKKDFVGDPLLYFEIEDTGIGIPEDKQDAVFKKFIQADISTARKYGGTGLGLAITKQLVEMMGGEIQLESEVGKGTTFIVEIPIEIASSQGDHDCARNYSPSMQMDLSARIMVVDDHPINLLFMCKVLKKIGFTHVDEANSGKEAIDLAKSKEYDLIFMDCQMPEIDGFEASERIRMMEGDKIGSTPIIAVTADAMKGARERCLDSGMNDYISKPVDIEKLRDILRKWQFFEISESLEESTVSIIESQEKTDTIVDWERLKLMTDNNLDETKEMIDLFTRYASETLVSLKDALEKGDPENWEKSAHKLKGSSANFGACALSNVCELAEKSGNEVLVQKRAIYDSIVATYQKTKSELTRPL